jgi:hypothetical protein
MEQSRSKRSVAAPGKKKAGRATSRRSKSSTSAVIDHAIATELAPAVAIAALDKSSQAPGAPAPALDVLAAGAVASETEGNVRVQLMFENGTVLPVEMTEAAGAALSKGLSDQLPKAKT